MGFRISVRVEGLVPCCSEFGVGASQCLSLGLRGFRLFGRLGKARQCVCVPPGCSRSAGLSRQVRMQQAGARTQGLGWFGVGVGFRICNCFFVILVPIASAELVDLYC